MDKLADGLQRLGEDDLLQVVQMVHDNKAPDSYTKNDVERKSSIPVRSSPKNQPLTTSNRRRIPCRPLYTARPIDQNALGVYTGKRSSVVFHVSRLLFPFPLLYQQ
jgi:hypothetical protein